MTTLRTALTAQHRADAGPFAPGFEPCRRMPLGSILAELRKHKHLDVDEVKDLIGAASSVVNNSILRTEDRLGLVSSLDDLADSMDGMEIA